MRPLQARLADAGLSSLGRAESHVLAAVEAVLLSCDALSGRPDSGGAPTPGRIDQAAGQRLLDAHTEAVLGPRPAGRGVAIMVTMPSEAADDYTLVSRLLQQGMDCMRINCAHDSPRAMGPHDPAPAARGGAARPILSGPDGSRGTQSPHRATRARSRLL